MGSHSFGESIHPIVMDYVNCSGSEFRLWDCYHFIHSYGCSHRDGAGVRCQPGICITGGAVYIKHDSQHKYQSLCAFWNKQQPV